MSKPEDAPAQEEHSQAPGDRSAPLEEALARPDPWWFVEQKPVVAREDYQNALAAIRVLKCGHGAGACDCGWCSDECGTERAEACSATGHRSIFCKCSLPWPCPIIAEAAQALRGEK